MLRKLLSITSVLIYALCCAQLAEIRSNQLSTSDGLSADNVTSFVQDDRGYMWIGTRDGLNRYDGRNFKIFRTQREGNCICGNNINLLEKDEQGTIWIGTFDGGLCSLNPVDLTFKHYPVRAQYPFATEKVMSMAIESNERIHVGFEKAERMLLHVPEGAFKMTGDTSMIANQTDYAMCYSLASGRLYHSPIHFGMEWVNEKSSGWVINRFVNGKPRGSELFPGYTMNTIHEDGEGVIWAGAWDNALHRYDPVKDELMNFTLDGGPVSFNDNEILCIEDGTAGGLWVGTRNDGLYIFDRNAQRFKKVRSRQNDLGSIQGKKVEALYRDQQGRMWVGSESGINLHDPLLDQFNVTMPRALEDRSILAFAQIGDTLLIGHDQGICIVSNGHHRNFNLQHEGKRLSVGVIHQDVRGRMLLGTNKSVFEWLGDDRLAIVPKIERQALLQYLDIRSSYVSDIAEYTIDGRDHLLAFYFGHDLLVMDPITGFGTPNHVGWEETYENLIRGLLIDSKERLWALGTSKGLVQVIDPFLPDSIQKGHGQIDSTAFRYELKVRSYFDAGVDGSKLRSHDVSDMVEREDGKFWITTYGAGLYLFDPEDPERTFIDMDCPVNSLHRLVIDQSGMLWMSTNPGLLRYDPSNENYEHFTQQSGIPSSGLSRALFLDESGKVVAGGDGFYVRFDPTGLQRNEHTADVFLDAIEVNGDPRNDMRGQDELKHDENFITFSFSSPNLTDPKNNTFQYKLLGVDDDWRTTFSEVKAQYTSLPTGDHKLLLRAANNNGVWSEIKEAYAFSITPPWWNRWWFYALVVLTITAILYAFYRYRIGQVRKLYEVRNTIAKDLHDDIGATLGSISIYSQVVKNRLKGSVKADDVIDMIGETSRRMVDRVGDIVWAVDPKNDQLDRSVKRMEDLAVPLCSAKDITFDMKADPAIKDMKLSMVQRKNLFLIYKEALHNAVKYSNADHIEVVMEIVGDSLRMNLRDNGIGFDPSQNGAYNGNGLNNMRSRAKELKGELAVRAQPGKGCSVELEFNV